MNAFIHNKKYVYIWVSMAPVWKEWRKKENSLEFN